MEDQNLLDLIEELQEKYQGALEDIKRLEEENIENTNLIYELMENVEHWMLVLTSWQNPIL
jgi:translation initiation factor IF-2